MPAIQSFISTYRPAWKATAVNIKSSFSRFNRPDPSSSDPPGTAPPPDSPALGSVLDIKDDSSMDFDGGRPDVYESDDVVVDRSSTLHSSRPSNVSSTSPPEKLEISLPPELRIDFFAEKFMGIPSGAMKAKADTSLTPLRRDTMDSLAEKVGDDQSLVQTLEDALALNIDSNPSRFMSNSGLDLELPGFTPTTPGPLTIPDGPPKHPRDSITMLTSRLSLGETPASSALSGTTLARALISNTFAMPIDRQAEGGLTRSDSSVLPRDSVHRNMFSIAPDAPPMPPNAEIQYVAPKRPRSERRRQVKRRSSTGTLSSKALPDLPSRRASLILSIGPEFGTFLKSPRPWSSDTPPVSSPSSRSIPSVVEPPTPIKDTPKSDSDSFTLPPLPEGVRRLPDPRSQQTCSAAVSPAVSTQSSTLSKELDTQGLEDVLDFYNLGESPSSFLAGAAFRPGFSPITEETGSRSSSASSPFRRESKRTPPVGGRSPRIRGDSMQPARRLSDIRPGSRQILMLSPSQNDSSAGLSERSVSVKSSRSLEPQRSDSASSYSQDTRNHHTLQRIQSIALQQQQQQQHRATSWMESSSPAEEEEEVQRSNEDDARRNGAADDTASASVDLSQPSSRRVSQSDGNYGSSDAPISVNLNMLPPIPTSPIEIMGFDRHEVHSQMWSEPSQTGFAAPSTSTTSLSVSPLLVRSNSLATTDEEAFSPTLAASSSEATSSTVEPVHAAAGSSTRMSIEKSVFSSRHPTTLDPLMSQHHHLYKDDFLGRNSTLSMGSPPPYYEVVNQANHHHHHHPPGPSTPGASHHHHLGPTDQAAGPSRLSGEWSINESRKDSPAARTRVRPRPPLPIGPRRPSQGIVAAAAAAAMMPPSSTALDRSASMGSSSQPSLSRQRSATRLLAIPCPKFQTPPPRWRGHTMDAARWTFKSSQLQAIVSKAIRQSSEASLIRLLEPEVLDNDIPAEIAHLETLRTDIKTRYKLLARKRATLFEALSASLTAGAAEEGSGYAYRLLEELSETAAALDHLAEELHSADTQLAHLDSLTQVHTGSALAVALRKLNTSFLKQMAENEDLRNDLFSVEAERDEAWLQAERLANDLDRLAKKTTTTTTAFPGALSASTAEHPSPITSNRSSRVSAHRKSLALASKAGLKLPKRRPSLKVTPSSTAFSSPFVSPESSKGGVAVVRPAKPVQKKHNPVSPESTTSSRLVVVQSPSSTTKALIQAQDELYTMLGITIPGLRRSRSWQSASPSSPQDSIPPPSIRQSVYSSSQSRRSSLPPDSTLAQVSNAMAADRKAMLVTFDMLSATDDDGPSG